MSTSLLGTQTKDSKNWLSDLLNRFEVDSEATLEILDGDSDWNQFATNQQKFKTKTSYRESDYTTELDVSAVPEHVKRRAEQIEKDIMKGGETKNKHLLEDRGLLPYGQDDEEDLFSAVERR